MMMASGALTKVEKRMVTVVTPNWQQTCFIVLGAASSFILAAATIKYPGSKLLLQHPLILNDIISAGDGF